MSGTNGQLAGVRCIDVAVALITTMDGVSSEVRGPGGAELWLHRSECRVHHGSTTPDTGSTRWVARDKSLRLKCIEPTLHRPPTPSPVKYGGVGHDVVKVLGRRLGDWVELVEGIGAADPSHGDAFCGRLLREVGVFASVAALLGAEPTDPMPDRRRHGE